MAATRMSLFWQILRRYNVELFVIGAIRIVAGREAAQKYIDRIEGRA